MVLLWQEKAKSSFSARAPWAERRAEPHWHERGASSAAKPLGATGRMDHQSTGSFGSTEHREEHQFPVSMSSDTGIAMRGLLVSVADVPKVWLRCSLPVPSHSRPKGFQTRKIQPQFRACCREKDTPVQANALAAFHPFDLWSWWFKRCSSPLQTERALTAPSITWPVRSPVL